MDKREGVVGPRGWVAPEQINRRAGHIMEEFDKLPRRVRDKINDGKPLSMSELSNRARAIYQKYAKAHMEF